VNRHLIRKWALMATVIAMTACHESSPGFYPGTLAEWQRDSAVVDSLSHRAPTDSLYAAYRFLLVAGDQEEAHRRILRMLSELHGRYGTYPAEIAIDRMKDTLWTPSDMELLMAREELPPGGMVVSEEACRHPRDLWAGSDSLPPAVHTVDPRHRPRYWGR